MPCLSLTHILAHKTYFIKYIFDMPWCVSLSRNTDKTAVSSQKLVWPLLYFRISPPPTPRRLNNFKLIRQTRNDFFNVSNLKVYAVCLGIFKVLSTTPTSPSLCPPFTPLSKCAETDTHFPGFPQSL